MVKVKRKETAVASANAKKNASSTESRQSGRNFFFFFFFFPLFPTGVSGTMWGNQIESTVTVTFTVD